MNLEELKEFNNLMEEWKDKDRDDKDKFVYDGIINIEEWNNQKTPKICFLLKEANASEVDDGYNLVKDLNEREPWNMWVKAAKWTKAIHNASLNKLMDLDIDLNKKLLHNTIKKIAVINVKKIGGNSSSNMEEINRFARKDAVEIRKEINLINPAIILCGYTIESLNEILGEELEMSEIRNKRYGFWNEKLILDFYHPACQYPNIITTHSLYSLYKTAEKSGWKY